MILTARESAAGWPDRRLILVIWERRAPETEKGAGDYGSVQRTNRETVVSLLYDGEHPLARSHPRSTSIAIYPEGLPANDAASAEIYGALTSASAEQLADSWLPRMLSLVAPGDALHPVYFPGTPSRREMDDAIRASITYPLTGTTPPQVDESAGHPVQTATRAISHPPLVTPYALFHAAQHFGLRNEPFSEVFVVWVHGGERNYAITIPQLAIKRDYGEQCAAYYRQARAVYVMQPDETRNADGELADGNVTVWRVQRRVAVQQPVEPRLVSHGKPAIFDRRKATLDVSMLPAAIGAHLREANLSTVRFVQWKVDYLDRRLTPIDAIATFKRSGLTYALPSPDAAIPIGRLIDDETRKSGALSFSDSMEIAARFDAAEPLPPYLQRIALRIPVVMHTNTAPITFEITSWPPEVTTGGLLVLAASAIYGLVRFLFRYRRRSLTVHVQWETTSVDEIKLFGPSTSHVVRFRYWLLDQSSFGPPWLWKSVRVELAMGNAITDLPLREGITHAALFVNEQPYPLSARIEPVKRMRITASRVPQGRGTPVEMRIDGSVIDFTRLRAARDLHGFYSLMIRTQPSMRYRNAEHPSSREYLVRVHAFRPEYVVSTARLAEIEQRGLFFDPKLSAAVDERQLQIGWLFVDNPTTAAGPALDITVRKITMQGVISGGLHDVHRVPAKPIPVDGDPSDITTTIPNAGCAQWDIFLTIPAATDWTEKTEWEIRVDAVVTVHVDGAVEDEERKTSLQCTWYPVNRSNFICVDLGTSATRILVQGIEELTFGFLPFPQSVRGPLAGPEELPSLWSVSNGKLLFGNEALVHGANKNFRLSVKQRLLDERTGSIKELRDYVGEMMKRFYVPEVHHADPQTLDTELIRYDAREGSVDIVRVERGRRHLAVCTIPNEASPALIRAYETAMTETNNFLRVLLLREGEAVAFDYIDRLHQTGGPRRSIRIVALDVGAGTSDVAMVVAELPAGQSEPVARVIAAAGDSNAGDAMDRAIFEILAASGRSVSMPRDFTALHPAAQYTYLSECDRVKRAIAAGKDRVTVNIPDAVDLDREFLDDIYQSDGYQNVLTDIVDGPVQMLLGRLPANAGAATHLVLTGRGSLIKGVKDRFVSAIAPIVSPEIAIENADGNAGLLKAAVSLGARSYVRKQWASVTLTEDFFPDRVVVIGVHDSGTDYESVVDAGTEYDKKTGGIDREVMLRWKEWSKALVVRTYLRTDDAIDPSLQLGPDARSRIVAGVPIGPSGLGYRVVKRLDRPEQGRSRTWKVGIHISATGTVTAKELTQ